jgi:hypothetical protein
MLRSLLLFGILFSHFSFLTAQEEDFIDSELNRTLEEERQSIDRRALQRPTPEDRNTEEAGLENTLQREEKALSQEELEKREEAEAQQITRNLDAALRNYERLIENQPKSQASTYKTRLNENQKLLQERQTRLNMSEDQLRQAKIELLGRYLRLKKAYEAGKLTERIFKKKESEILEQYSYSKQALENDIALYQKDINEAEETNSLSPRNPKDP